ncbi:MAG: peptidylprolyl isomerase [Bacteroidetes bacterium]|nr:peptidylprolyl isomerase [Bacteroidota bacterium]
MKKCLLSLVLLFSLSTSALFAQGIDKPIYQIVTHRDTAYLGTFTVELFPLIAPNHVHMFDSLVSTQFFDSTAFHRVVPGFVIQGGDPNTISGPMSTWGQGQPWQPTVNAEFSTVRHLRGILGAARDTDPNSANSQFYICVAPATFLDGNYTVYGKVTNGMSVVDTIVLSPRDVNDIPLQKITMFVTYIGVNDTVPAAPSLVSPANNSTNISNGQFFNWTAVPGAVMYTLQFSTDSLFSTIAFERTAGTNTANAPQLPGSNTYFWRVKANNGGHESVFSNVWKFTTLTGAVTLISPPDSETNIFVNPLFEWSSVAGADNYQLQVATTVTFSGVSLVYNQLGITNTYQQVPALNANTQYYWRVKSFNGAIAGYLSTRFTFETGTATGILSAQEEDVITSIYPNPAAQQLNVELKMKDKAPLRMNLKDVQGKIVWSQEYKFAEELQVKIDLSTFSKGLYLLEVQQGTYFVSEKIIVE